MPETCQQCKGVGATIRITSDLNFSNSSICTCAAGKKLLAMSHEQRYQLIMKLAREAVDAARAKAAEDAKKKETEAKKTG